MGDGEARRDEVTTGELNRSIAQMRIDHSAAMEKLERAVRERVDLIRDDLKEDTHRLEGAIRALSFVSQDSFEAAQMEIHRRLEAMEAWQTWAIRLLLGVVVTALIGAVLAMAGVSA